MLSQLLKDKKKLKGKTLSKKFKGKQKKGESSSSANTESKNHSKSKPPKSSSEDEDNSENGSSHSKRIRKLEQRLEALQMRRYPRYGDSSTLPSRVAHDSLPSEV